jgi:hypothetical protein
LVAGFHRCARHAASRSFRKECAGRGKTAPNLPCHVASYAGKTGSKYRCPTSWNRCTSRLTSATQTGFQNALRCPILAHSPNGLHSRHKALTCASRALRKRVKRVRTVKRVYKVNQPTHSISNAKVHLVECAVTAFWRGGLLQLTSKACQLAGILCRLLITALRCAISVFQSTKNAVKFFAH